MDFSLGLLLLVGYSLLVLIATERMDSAENFDRGELGVFAKGWWQNQEGFLLAVEFRHNPGFVIVVVASPIRIGAKMGAPVVRRA